MPEYEEEYGPQPAPVMVQQQVDTKALEFILWNDLKKQIDKIENPSIRERIIPFATSKLGPNTALSRNDSIGIWKREQQYEIDRDRLLRRIPKYYRTAELYSLLDNIQQVYFEYLGRSLNGEERKAINTTISESRNASTVQPAPTSGGGFSGFIRRLMPQ